MIQEINTSNIRQEITHFSSFNTVAFAIHRRSHDTARRYRATPYTVNINKNLLIQLHVTAARGSRAKSIMQRMSKNLHYNYSHLEAIFCLLLPKEKRS